MSTVEMLRERLKTHRRASFLVASKGFRDDLKKRRAKPPILGPKELKEALETRRRLLAKIEMTRSYMSKRARDFYKRNMR